MMFWVFGTNVFTTLVYWSVGGIYTFMDITNRPTFLRKYKIQPGTNEPVDQARLFKVSVFCLFFLFFIYLQNLCHYCI